MKKLMVVALTLMVVLCFGAISFAGSLDDTGSPTDPSSAMFTLEDIYNRLGTGAAGTKRTGAFVEPSSGPTAGTGHTLDEVMGKAPSLDEGNGACATDVASGKTFWGLTSGAWGLQTGTSAGGGSAAVAKTGQTATYATGDDGDLEKGVAWPNPRFTANTGGETGTVTDNLTGLMWAQNANAGGTKTWSAALTYCNDLSLGTYTDWRLPNVKELLSLIDWAYSDPALSNDAGTGKWTSGVGSSFTGVQAVYWSSTTYADVTGVAWLVGMDDGSVNGGAKSVRYYVWPVRGGQ